MTKDHTMTKDQQREALLSLREDLRLRLLTWPANTSLLFDASETAELETAFGPNWRAILSFPPQ
jgi:hypothetical protein